MEIRTLLNANDTCANPGENDRVENKIQLENKHIECVFWFSKMTIFTA